MSKYMDKSKTTQAVAPQPQQPQATHVSAPQQPKATQVSAPQQPKATQVSVPPQPKAAQVPAPQQAYNISRPKPAATATLTHEDIARRAYQIYIEKGCPQDQSEEIWLQAERNIKNRCLSTSLLR